MTWTAFSTVTLGHIWVYTDPIEGEYFKFKHNILLEDTPYLLAQVVFNVDGSIEYFDIQKRYVYQKLELLRLKTPAVIQQRRLAFKRLSKAEALESQLRKLVFSTFLIPSREPIYRPQRSDWKIEIEISDILSVAEAIDGGAY